MNRLWVRFALVISGILVLAMILPFIAAIQFEMSPELSGELESVVRALPAEQRAELRVQVETAISFFFSRSLILAAVAGTVAGVLLSWTLLSPLQELTRGAEAIAARDLAHRVRVRGSRELRAVAESFNHMAGRLEQAETLRRQLLADVAHELRNPLHVLRGNLQAIFDGVYPLNQAEVSRLLEQTDHLTRLVNDLHELALAEARQLPLNRRPTDLGALVKDSASGFLPLAAADGIALRVELLGAPPTVDVDADRIRQTMHNLLANALRHTPPGGNVLVSVGPRTVAAEAHGEDQRRQRQGHRRRVQFADGGVHPDRGGHGRRQRPQRGERPGRAQLHRQQHQQGHRHQPPDEGVERHARRRLHAGEAQRRHEQRAERRPLRIAAVVDGAPARQGVLVLAHVGHVGVAAAVDDRLHRGQVEQRGHGNGEEDPEGAAVGEHGGSKQ